jgi:AAA domain
MSEHGVAMDFDAAPTRQIADKIRGFDQIPDIMTMEIPPIEYLVDGMIARKTITLWTGTDGTAKTYLAQKMAIAVAMGGEFLGRRCQRAPVLYLDYENPGFAVRERLDLMSGGPIVGLKVWGTWLEQQPPQIGNELLLTIAKDTKPLIIVDPFRYAHGAEENDSTEMMGVMQCLRYCAAAGGAVVALHHPAKTEGSTGRGSTAIKGAVDVAFLQEMSDETGLITLACVKNRFGERHNVTIRPDYEEGTFTVTDSAQFAKRSADQEVLRKIIEENPGLTQNSVFDRSGMMKARVGRLLKEGLDSLWTAAPGPNRSKNYYPIGWFPTLKTTERTTEPLGEQSVSGSGGSP